MDRNTLIGLGLIGVVLAIFTYINQPDPELIRQQQELAQKELEERQRAQREQADESLEEAENILPTNWIAKTDEEGNLLKDSLGVQIYLDTVTQRDTTIQVAPDEVVEKIAVEDSFKGEAFHIHNDKLFFEVSTKGGMLTAVFLKEHQTYDDFMKNRDTDSITPLQFMDENAANQLVFQMGGELVETGKLPFEVVQHSDEYIELRHVFSRNKFITYKYSIVPGSYHLNYEIQMNGLQADVLAENVLFDWQATLLQTERLLSEQRRTSTVFFKGIDESYDYLSEFSDDDIQPKHDIEWVAFKQSYFSSILMPENGFKKEGSELSITSIDENSSLEANHIKHYAARVNLNIPSTADGSVKMRWFFGPNDYYLLSSYGNESEDIINLGWGLFRWVNIYAIQPIFSWLTNFGIGMGLAIFLLTLIVKIALTPIQWKMYSSSAKMRILKPEIDALNKKFPNKEDGMKKQMEMMNLYRETGSSPLAGCVPMLIQMPILFAVFRFFPSTFELRQKGFLWAEDLSSFDSVLDLGFEIPFYGDHVSLFTLLMAGTTLIYTMLNSSNMAQPQQPGMPNMKVIMYIFPFMMIFFFNNFASGLSYYYFLSTLLSILTMILIKEVFVDEAKLKEKMAARKAANQAKGGGKAKKSKFQERLEQMQKAQMEQMKKKGKK